MKARGSYLIKLMLALVKGCDSVLFAGYTYSANSVERPPDLSCGTEWPVQDYIMFFCVVLMQSVLSTSALRIMCALCSNELVVICI